MKLEKNEIRLIEKEDKKSKKKNKKENISNNEELDEDVDTDTSVLDSDVEVIDDDHVLYSEVDVVSGYSNTNNDEELVEDLESLEDINIEKNVGDGDAEEEEVI